MNEGGYFIVGGVGCNLVSCEAIISGCIKVASSDTEMPNQLYVAVLCRQMEGCGFVLGE